LLQLITLIEARLKLLTIHSVIDVISSSLLTILILKNESLKLAILLIDNTLIFKSFRVFLKCLLILISGQDRSPRIKNSFVFFIGIPWHLEPLRMKFIFLIYWISIIVIKNKKINKIKIKIKIKVSFYYKVLSIMRIVIILYLFGVNNFDN